MKKLYFLIFIAAVSAACKKTNSKPETAQPVLASSRFYYFDGSYYTQTYTYNASGLLVRDQDHTSEGRLMSSREYRYDQNKLLKEVTLNSATARVAQYQYTYQDGKPVKLEYLEYSGGSAEKIYEQLFEYKAGELQKISMNYFNGPPSYYILVTRTGRNITGQKTYLLPGGVLSEETTYEYDSHINPYNRLGFPDLGNPRYASANNVIRILTTKTATGLTEEISSEFEYNAAGLPLRQDNRFKDGRRLHEQSYTYR